MTPTTKKGKKINWSEEPTRYQKEFLDWLEKNPAKKKDLHGWDDLAKIIDNDKTDETKCLEIDFDRVMFLSRRWQSVKERLLEYWKTFYWWAATEKHDFSQFGSAFHEIDYFIRHYQNSTEELFARIKKLETENTKLKEELDIEQETNQESAEVMNDFYRRQFIENQTPNILKDFSIDYLKISRENQTQKKEIQKLKTDLDLAKQLASLQIHKEKTEVQIQIPPK